MRSVKISRLRITKCIQTTCITFSYVQVNSILPWQLLMMHVTVEQDTLIFSRTSFVITILTVIQNTWSRHNCLHKKCLMIRDMTIVLSFTFRNNCISTAYFKFKIIIIKFSRFPWSHCRLVLTSSLWNFSAWLNLKNFKTNDRIPRRVEKPIKHGYSRLVHFKHWQENDRWKGHLSFFGIHMP